MDQGVGRYPGVTREEIAPKLSQVVASVCEVPPWHFAKHPAPQFHVPFPFSFEYASRSDATPRAGVQPAREGRSVQRRPNCPHPAPAGLDRGEPLGEPKRSFRPQVCIGPKGRSRKAVQAQAAYSGARKTRALSEMQSALSIALPAKARYSY